MTTAVEQQIEMGDWVKILRLKNPQDTRFTDIEVQVTGLTSKGWVKVNLPDDSGSATLKPDWVEKVQKQDIQEATPADTEVAPSVEIVKTDESQNDLPDPDSSAHHGTGCFKFSCNSSILSKTVGQVKRSMRSLSIHPVLNNLKIVVDADTKKVELTGFDLNLGIIASFGVDSVEQGGAYTIDANLLYGLVSQLPQSIITLEKQPESAQVKLTTANGSYLIAGLDAYEFPELPLPQPSPQLKMWRVAAKTLRAGILATAYAASGDPTKMVLCGLHCTATAENKLEIAATDGHRMALYRSVLVSGKNLNAEEHVTIPVRSIYEVDRYLGEDEAIIEISYETEDGYPPSVVQFRCGDTLIVTRTLEGKYPEYNQLIPTKFQREFWVERGTLIGSICRIAVTADTKHQIIKIDIDPDKKRLTLYSQNAEVGSGQEALNAEISGEPLTVAFNIKYLLDAIKTLGTQEVAISLNEKATPVICTPLNGHDIVTLIMPVQIRE